MDFRDFFPTKFSNSSQQQLSVDVVAGTLLRDLYTQPRLIDDHKPRTLALVVASMAMEALKMGIKDESWMGAIQPSIDVARFQRLKERVVYSLYGAGGGNN